jgi:nucleotide-binding universal stress UspA family protein
MKKILIPCDFSEISENALNYAVGIAKYFSSSLVLLHVDQIPVMNSEFGLSAYTLTDTTQDTLVSLKQLAKKIQKTEPTITDIECYSEMGNITDVIVSYCNKLNVDLTVMGISGHGSKFMKNIIGSTSVAVAKQIEMPLMIVPPKVTFKKIQNVAYACEYDKNLEQNSSLIQVKYLNTIFGSKLNVLHVLPEAHDLDEKEAQIDDYVEHKLENAAHRTFMLTENETSKALLDFVKNHEIDLLIVEPKKHSLFHKIFFPSTTNEVAFFSTVPVLTIHG